MRRGGFKRKLYRLTYDRPEVHRRALQLWHSLEEVEKLLEEAKCGKPGKLRRK